MNRQTVLSTALGAAALSMVGAACAGGSDKSGGDAAATTTLQMAIMEPVGAPYTDAVREFERQVEEISEGELRIKIVWSAADEFLGGYGPGAEQDVAGLIQNGKLDLGLIPARAWDRLGVTSLQALQAPFLVSSDELVKQLVQSELAEKMLTGLDKAGVVGLALMPEGLRHPVGFARPFLVANDFAGARIRTPPSNVSYRLLEALGAKPVDISGDDFMQAARTGKVEGAESAFALAGDLPDPSTFTANLTFYPKVNVVVVNEKAFGRLSEEQRKTLREAAAKTLADLLRNTPSETERAAVYCRNGGTIAFASEADVAALEQAADPVYKELEADPQTKELIEQIRRMKEQLSGARDPVPEGCTPASGGVVLPTSSAPEPSEFPEGVYRADLPPEYLIEKGIDPVAAHELGGLVTLSFEDGRWRAHTQGIAEDCGGSYSVEAGRISLGLDAPKCREPVGTLIMSARWKRENGELHFFDIRRGSPIGWGSKPWTKID